MDEHCSDTRNIKVDTDEKYEAKTHQYTKEKTSRKRQRDRHDVALLQLNIRRLSSIIGKTASNTRRVKTNMFQPQEQTNIDVYMKQTSKQTFSSFSDVFKSD